MLVFRLWEGAEVPGKNPGTHRKNIQPPQKKKVQPVCREATVPVTALLCHPQSIDFSLFHPFCKEHHHSTNICPSPLLSWLPNRWQHHQLPPEDRSLPAYNHWEYLTSQLQFLVLDSSSYLTLCIFRAFLKKKLFLQGNCCLISIPIQTLHYYFFSTFPPFFSWTLSTHLFSHWNPSSQSWTLHFPSNRIDSGFAWVLHPSPKNTEMK